MSASYSPVFMRVRHLSLSCTLLRSLSGQASLISAQRPTPYFCRALKKVSVSSVVQGKRLLGLTMSLLACRILCMPLSLNTPMRLRRKRRFCGKSGIVLGAERFIRNNTLTHNCLRVTQEINIYFANNTIRDLARI